MAVENGPRPVRAARGTALTCRGWQQEAALRMLMNSLDPEIADRPDDPIGDDGRGRVARNRAAFDAIAHSLTELGDDETLLVRSGEPDGVLRTDDWAPRVLIAHSDPVESLGSTMHGRTAAGSWMSIGSQDVLQGTYETFGAVARSLGRASLAGTITVTAGLGRMGGAQPPAVTLHGGVVLCIEVDPDRIARHQGRGRLDVSTRDAAEALTLAIAARDENRPLSIGLLGNAAEELPRLLAAGAPVDIVTDQTSAHDPLAYLPIGVRLTDRRRLAEQDPVRFTELARTSMTRHVAAMVGFRDAGATVFDYGNSIRDEAYRGGYARAFEIPGLVSTYLRPLVEEGRAPLRAVALSGDPADIAAADRAIRDLFPDDTRLHRWLTLAGRKVRFEGLPARSCWLGPGERCRAGLRFNEMVASGAVSAPIVIGCDHVDAGSATGSLPDAAADALVSTASGATWVSIHRGGESGRVCVADGTELAAAKIERALSHDPKSPN